MTPAQKARPAKRNSIPGHCVATRPERPLLRRSKPDDSSMFARWEVLLLAAALAGAAMLIENSHRLDAGAPDDDVDVVATSSATCADQDVTAHNVWNRSLMIEGAEGFELSTDSPTPSGCAPE
jgi:hypothetical protein